MNWQMPLFISTHQGLCFQSTSGTRWGFITIKQCINTGSIIDSEQMSFCWWPHRHVQQLAVWAAGRSYSVNVVIIGSPSFSVTEPNAGGSFNQPPVVHYGTHSSLIRANPLWWAPPAPVSVGVLVHTGPPRRWGSDTGKLMEKLKNSHSAAL